MLSRRHQILLMTLSLVFNTGAMMITIAYARGTVIIETNPMTRSSIATLGSLAPLANCAVIILIYLAILRVEGTFRGGALGKFAWFVEFGLDFSALLLPIVTFLDVFGDVAVVFFGANLMTLTQLLVFSPLVAFDFAMVFRALPAAARTVTRLKTIILR